MPLPPHFRPLQERLHPLAVPLEGKLGRRVPEQPDETRLPFQRDGDRIIHTSAFRRLQGKTQVFVSGEGDHFRTRLTHTLEVSQIARSIARVLALNEDLSECIALAHDLGHPPFGHAGEDAIDRFMQSHGGQFEHNEQSFRIVTLLEKRSLQYRGLNLNREVEEGLLKHTELHPLEGHALTPSLEAQVVNLSDEIAYTSHDSDDGLTAGLFSIEELTQIPLAAEAHALSQERGTYIRDALIHLLVRDLLAETTVILGAGERLLRFSPAMRERMRALQTFLQEKMYKHPRIADKAKEGQIILIRLCDFYLKDPHGKILRIQEKSESTLVEAVKDYVAGMTDSFAWYQAAEHGLLAIE